MLYKMYDYIFSYISAPRGVLKTLIFNIIIFIFYIFISVHDTVNTTCCENLVILPVFAHSTMDYEYHTGILVYYRISRAL